MLWFNRQVYRAAVDWGVCAWAPSTAGCALSANPSWSRGSPALGATGTGWPRSPGRTAHTCTPGTPLTCSQKHKHVNTIRIKTSAPSHAALLSTHPTGSWSDRTSPAAGRSKPYSPWARDSSRSFCAEEHTLEIIHLWILLRVWTHFSSVNLTVSSLWDATMTFAILLWLISSRMYSRHLTDRDQG